MLSSSPIRSPVAPARRPLSRRRCLLLGALLPLAWILQLLGAAFPQGTEAWFSKGVGPMVQELIGIPVRILPFSVSELILIGLGIYVPFRLIQGLRAWRRGAYGAREMFQRGGLQALGACGVIYFYFVIAWGMNYGRASFAENAGWSLAAPEAGDLEHLVTRLVQEVNRLRPELEEDEDGVFRLRKGKDGVLKDLPLIFDKLSETYPFLEGPAPISRRPWVSPLMTAFGISGIFSPFTGESHVNGTLLDLSFAFAACHEAAHRRGIAREDEANFVAYKLCLQAEQKDLRYAGTVIALNYALNDMFRNDRERALELMRSLVPSVTRDRMALAEFWRPKSGVLSLVRSMGERTNDVYLKSQSQTAGTASYGQVVRLLITDERARASTAQR